MDFIECKSVKFLCLFTFYYPIELLIFSSPAKTNEPIAIKRAAYWLLFTPTDILVEKLVKCIKCH